MPNEFSRIDRVQDLIQQILAVVIQQELKDPRLGMVTVTEVAVSKDLSFAKVYVSVYPDEKVEESLRVLNHAAGFLRAALSKKIQIRTLPHLKFIYDDLSVRANRMFKRIEE